MGMEVVSPALVDMVAEGCAWLATEGDAEAEALGDGLEWLVWLTEAPGLAEEYPGVAPEPLEVDVAPEVALVEVLALDVEDDLVFCFYTWT